MPLLKSSAHRTPAELASASQWRLIWWRFLDHRLAVWSGAFVILLYVFAVFAEFVSPASPTDSSGRYTYAPPQPIHLFHRDDTGSLSFRPHVLGYSVTVNPDTFSRSFEPDPARVIEIRLFPEVEPYRMWGLIELNRRLVGPVEQGQPFYLLGADRLGRDVLSRLIHGARISLSVGLIGVLLSLALGIVIGGFSGFLGGRVDLVVQRIIEILRSLPTIPLWLGLAAAMPRDWSSLQIYFAMTIILSLVGWTELARVVRSRFLSLRHEDYVIAAQIEGMPTSRVIVRHMLPAMTSHVIATATLAVPTMILAETALSFLGLGLQPPTVSWGVLLQEAQNIRSISTAPWLLVPGLLVTVTVLAMNFLGDGLRDAADPYGH